MPQIRPIPLVILLVLGCVVATVFETGATERVRTAEREQMITTIMEVEHVDHGKAEARYLELEANHARIMSEPSRPKSGYERREDEHKQQVINDLQRLR